MDEKSIKYFAKEIYKKIDDALKQPAYWHEDEDWMVGLIMAEDILCEVFEEIIGEKFYA